MAMGELGGLDAKGEHEDRKIGTVEFGSRLVLKVPKVKWAPTVVVPHCLAS